MPSSLICDALNRRQLLRFRYKDHTSPTTVEPYTYGENKTGNLVLSAWLVSGATHDTKSPFWRLYREDDMHSVEVLSETFSHDREGYNPNDGRFQVIRCKVATAQR